MAVFTAPCPYLFHTPAQSFPYRLALDDPVSTACFGPIVGKSQKVEAPLAPGRFVSTRRPLELNQHRLFGMNGQTEAIEPLRQDRHNPAGVFFSLASDDEIIRKTHHKTSALHPGLDVLDKPVVQDLMQEYIRHHRRDHPALRRALVRVRELSRLQHAGVQPLSDQSQDSPIVDPLRDK